MMRDPYAQRSKSLRRWLGAGLVLVLLGAAATQVNRQRRGYYFWQSAPAVEVAEEAAAAPDSDAQTNPESGSDLLPNG